MLHWIRLNSLQANYMRVLTFFKHIFKPSWKKIIFLFLIFAIAGGGYWYYQSQNAKKEAIKTTTVTRSDIKETVSASGVLKGKTEAQLKFISSGKLAFINIKEGDQVTKGQSIAGLDTQELSIKLQQARNTYTAKDATAKRAEDEIKGNDTDENFEQKEDRVLAQIDRDNAYDAMKQAQRAFQDAVLISPIAGVVTQAKFLPGQNVSVADLIAEIVDESEIYLDAEVDEADIGKVTIGASADITLNSYPDKTFTGIVTQITPNTQKTDTGATVVVVRIKLDDQSILFVSNVNGQADIVTNQTNNVLILPIDTLVEEKYVYLKQGEEYQKTEIQIGLTSETDFEVKSGLSEGQEVVTNPSAVEKK